MGQNGESGVSDPFRGDDATPRAAADVFGPTAGAPEETARALDSPHVKDGAKGLRVEPREINPG